MSDKKNYAVLTGDVVHSSNLVSLERERLLLALKNSFAILKKEFPDEILYDFEIHRGDSFQGVLKNPRLAMKAAIMIRTLLRMKFEVQQVRFAADARIAIGIGTIDYFPEQRGTEGDGDAFRRSGQSLDKMKGEKYLFIKTPWPEVDAELCVECALLDVLLINLSNEQAMAMVEKLKGKTQEAIAKKLKISQPAVLGRLKRAGFWAVEELCRRYEHLIATAEGDVKNKN